MASKKKLKTKIKRLEAQRHSLPKRVMGVKIPKELRRIADTQLGSTVLAQMIVGGGAAALTSPQARRVRRQVQQFALLAAHSLSSATQEAAQRMSDAFREDEPVEDERPARKKTTRNGAGVATH